MMNDITFQHFWDRYGKKRERSDAERAWQRLTDKEQRQAVDGIDAYRRRSGQQGMAIPYPAAYLNQHLWQKPKRGGRGPARPAHSLSAAADPFNEMELW